MIFLYDSILVFQSSGKALLRSLDEVAEFNFCLIVWSAWEFCVEYPKFPLEDKMSFFAPSID
ncbi:hypothetical protein ONA23_05840 [Mycoplasmopsis cynos]|uniref:hypothetical protein n=1 Tax=Mycoplasmopsis cynos TaxID=171284 RepID=UPI0024CC5574|nr:hypothetical protein [Mycoplasmopsis cynos]WAM06464.1 hypothetical protein ONA23_05840 [Mycoplasmopsis cynos]